jgi:hypothetical protein
MGAFMLISPMDLSFTVVLLKSGFMLGKVDFLVLLCVLFGQKKGM